MIADDIDLPGRKHVLWHGMRGDLEKYIPEIAENRLLLCPTCCRFLPQEDFSVEHTIPQQALAEDLEQAKQYLTRNQRGVLTLLCTKDLLVRGKAIHKGGCNSWKGRYFDRPLREIFNGRASLGRNFTSRHHVALSVACFLGLFCEFGYQVALSQSGATMRRQFFTPNNFVKQIPIMHQIALLGEPPSTFEENDTRYWIPPFKFLFEEGCCLVVVRNTSIRIPLSRNPEIPLAFRLPFAPSRFKLRPNFDTVFR